MGGFSAQPTKPATTANTGNTSSTTNSSNTTNTTNTTNNTEADSWTPPSNSTLYKDRVQVSGDELVIEEATMSKSSSSNDIATLQAQYNKNLTTYQNDLNADKAKLSASGTPGGRTPPSAEMNFDNDESDAIAGKSDKSDYHQLTFTNAAAGSSHSGGTVAADGFPGGQGDPEWFGDETLQKGYVTPPTISSGSDISDVYNNLDMSQAAYLGWALQETDAGKQVSIPTGDLQSWNLLSEYAKENNKELGTGNPDDSHEFDESIDDEVDSSFQTNQKTDPGKIVSQAFTGIFTLGLGTSLSGIIPGQAGTILGNLAGTAAAAIVGVGLGGEAAGSLSAALSGGVAGGALDLADLLSSLNNVLSAGSVSEAGSALVAELQEVAPGFLNGTIPDTFTLKDSFDHDSGG